MLQIILGKSGEKSAREKINDKVSEFSQDKPFSRMDEFSFDIDLIRSSVESDSLFSFGKTDILADIFVFDNILQNEDIENFFLELSEEMQNSQNIFICIESEMLADSVNKFKKKNVEINDLRTKSTEAKKWGGGSEAFALPDAIGRNSPKDAWIEFQKSLMDGGIPEEIFGRIWGKIRDMEATRKASAESLGIHPFVYKKAKEDSKNWPEEKSKSFAENLIKVYHRSRMGGDELTIGLEKLILTL